MIFLPILHLPAFLIAFYLSRRLRELQERLQERESDLRRSKDEYGRHESELATQVKNLQQQLAVRSLLAMQSSIQVDTSFNQDEKEATELRVVRLVNENSSFHEANVRAMKVQHQRELACLREELAAERARLPSAV